MGHVKWWPLAAFVAIFVTDLSSVSAKDVGRYGKVCLSTVKIHPTMTCDLIANMCKVRSVPWFGSSGLSAVETSLFYHLCELGRGGGIVVSVLSIWHLL